MLAVRPSPDGEGRRPRNETYPMITMNTRTARAAGFRALTCRYYLPEEQEMLDGVLADMRRGNIKHVLVKDRLGVAVWRSFRSGTVANGRRVAA